MILGSNDSKRRYCQIIIILLLFVTVIILVYYLSKLMYEIPLYVISLQRATERHAHIAYELRRLSYTMIEAVDGSNMTDHQTRYANNYTDPSRLLPGEVGCMLSHILLWKRILSEGKENAVVFEDDVALKGPIRGIVSKIARRSDIDFAYLGYCFEDTDGVSVVRAYPYNVRKAIRAECTHGYFITRNGCQALLHCFHVRKCIIPVDDCIRDCAQRELISAMIIDPPIASVKRLQSTIDFKRQSMLDGNG